MSASTILSAQQSESNVSIRTDEDLVWVQASNVTARELAEELSSKLDINIVLTGDAETLLNIDISEETLAQAVARMSPNNLLVRESADSRSKIIEVVLMLGEANGLSAEANGVSAADDQFLPSGSAGEEIVSGDYNNQYGESAGQLKARDYIQPGIAANIPNQDRSGQTGQSVNAASYDASLPPPQTPPLNTTDEFGPPTGLLVNQ